MYEYVCGLIFPFNTRIGYFKVFLIFFNEMLLKDEKIYSGKGKVYYVYCQKFSVF